MLTRRASFLALVTALIAISTSGCFAESADPTPTSSALSPSPLFASDEEALAAATEAYAAYLQVADDITASGASDVSALDAVVTPDYLASQVPGYEEFRAKGLRTTGSTKYQQPNMQSVSNNEKGETEVVTYLCIDVSDVRIIDAAGGDVTPGDRVNQYPLVVTFSVVDTSEKLRVDASESWSGANFCEA